MVIFISKITITTTSPILHFAPMRTHSTPHSPKKAKLLSFGVSQPFVSIPVFFVNKKFCRGVNYTATEPQVTVQISIP